MSGGTDQDSQSYLLGFEFTANSPIEITELGQYDAAEAIAGENEFQATSVALYDITTNTPLGSVPGQGCTTDGLFCYGTLSSPVTLNTHDDYAVVWAPLSNVELGFVTLTTSDVNPAIRYVAAVGYGAGGQTAVEGVVEPNFFYTVAQNGAGALNYEGVGPNFMFTTP
ncbi:MAG TPA: hypothetical protein VED63_00905 [Acidimicrobiales bacterium]|nr:hypothetical protein [Acidimicrobiales bacterium]